MIPIRLNFIDGAQEPVVAMAVPQRDEYVITRKGVFVVVGVQHTYSNETTPGVIDVELSELSELGRAVTVGPGHGGE